MRRLRHTQAKWLGQVQRVSGTFIIGTQICISIQCFTPARTSSLHSLTFFLQTYWQSQALEPACLSGFLLCIS